MNIPDKVVNEAASEFNLEVFEALGPEGTIYVADTLNIHKAAHVQPGHRRLVLEIMFTNLLVGPSMPTVHSTTQNGHIAQILDHNAGELRGVWHFFSNSSGR